MSSWVYLFSKFTPEALLFEALIISLLIAGYSAYWVLHKRRMGALHNSPEIPSPLIKNYLNELIIEAEQMRAQLFGLLAGTGGFDPSMLKSMGASPEVGKKMFELEAKMSEQSAAMQAAILEKTRLEKELETLKATGAEAASSAPAAPVNNTLIAELESKIKNLEGKLAEYSVIEDDLANLKRLQQENAQLRASLAGKGSATAAATPEPAVATPPAPAPTVASSPTQAPTPATPKPEPTREPMASPLDAATASLPESGRTDQASIDALFSGLDSSVSKSLAPEPIPEPAAAAPTPAPKPTTPEPAAKPATAAADKTDADLVAEFEKMLNG